MKSCQPIGGSSKPKKRADERTRTADLLITSEPSGVAEVCTGMQIPHIYAAFSSLGCPVLHCIALPVVSEWCQFSPRCLSSRLGARHGTSTPRRLLIPFPVEQPSIATWYLTTGGNWCTNGSSRDLRATPRSAPPTPLRAPRGSVESGSPPPRWPAPIVSPRAAPPRSWPARTPVAPLPSRSRSGTPMNGLARTRPRGRGRWPGRGPLPGAW
jgi:hypothetical protein